MNAVDLVSEAYQQGITDGHALNRARGVVEELHAAKALDDSRAELLAALRRVGCQDEGCGPLEEDGFCFVCAAIAKAEGQS